MSLFGKKDKFIGFIPNRSIKKTVERDAPEVPD